MKGVQSLRRLKAAISGDLKSLFTSARFKEHVDSIVKMVSARYGNASMYVKILWGGDTVAYTDNRVVAVNADNVLMDDAQDPETRYLRFLGFLGHELGHVLFTDFEATLLWHDALKNGRLFMGNDPRWDKEAGEIVRYKDFLSPIFEIYRNIDNIVEDRFVNDRIKAIWPGTFKRGIEACQKRQFSVPFTMEPDEDISNLLKATLVLVMDQPVPEKAFDEYPCLKDIKQEVSTIRNADTVQKRMRMSNDILLIIWPYIKDILDKAADLMQQMQKMPPMPPMGQNGMPVPGASGQQGNNTQGDNSGSQSQCSAGQQGQDPSGEQSGAGSSGIPTSAMDILNSLARQTEEAASHSSQIGKGTGVTCSRLSSKSTFESGDKTDKKGDKEEGKTGNKTDKSKSSEKSSDPNEDSELSGSSEQLGDDPSGENGKESSSEEGDGEETESSKSKEGEVGENGNGKNGNKSDNDADSSSSQGSEDQMSEHGWNDVPADVAFNGQDSSGSDLDATSVIEHLLNDMAREIARKDPDKAEQLVSQIEANEITQERGTCHTGFPFEVRPVKSSGKQNKVAYDMVAHSVVPYSKILRKKLMDVLEEQESGAVSKNLLQGNKINPAASASEKGRIFKRTNLPEERSLAVSVLIDQSGSMMGTRLNKAMEMAIILEDLCRGMSVPISICGHYDVGHKEIVESYVRFGDEKEDRKYALTTMRSGGCNRDGLALRHCIRMLLQRDEETKLMIIISDGRPNSDRYSGLEAEEDLYRCKKELEKAGGHLIAASIGDDKDTLKRIYRDSFLDISDINTMPTKMAKLVASFIA